MGIRKSFRLFDFNVYDEDKAVSADEPDSDDSNENNYRPMKDEKSFIIQMFGVNEKGETCCLYVEDYTPFFFVKVGDNWTEYDKRCFVDELKKKVGKMFQDFRQRSQHILSRLLTIVKNNNRPWRGMFDHGCRAFFWISLLVKIPA